MLARRRGALVQPRQLDSQAEVAMKGTAVHQRTIPATSRLVRAALAAWLVTAIAAAAGLAAVQEPGIALHRWTANDAPKFESLEGLIRGSASKGWLESQAKLVDFVLQLEFRVAEPGSKGAVLVRAWDGDKGRSGYRIAVEDPAAGMSLLGTVTSRRNKKEVGSGNPRPAPASTGNPTPAGEWHRLEVRCEHDRVTVALDGATINDVNGSEPLAGYVGLEVARGVIEFRRATVVQLAGGVHACSASPPAGGLPAGATGLTLPRLVREEKPVYTREAMRRKVQGTVVLDAIVGVDGAVQTVCVARSLDPALDAQAVGAARRWRFTPGQKDGNPVPVFVTIELTFTLR
jgi:TonB family protein